MRSTSSLVRPLTYDYRLYVLTGCTSNITVSFHPALVRSGIAVRWKGIVYKIPAVHRRGKWSQTITAALENKIHALQQISHVILKYTLKKSLKRTNGVFLNLWKPDSEADWQIRKNTSQEHSEPLRSVLLPSCITWATGFHPVTSVPVQNMAGLN